MFFVNLFLALIAMFWCYRLALAFIGMKRTTKQVITPVLVFTIIIFALKMVFKTTPTVHTIILVLLCGILLWVFNKIDPVLSFIGSLLSFTTATLGDLLVSYPLLIKIGFKLPTEPDGLEWIYLNILDISIIVLAIIIIRLIKFSITKYLPIESCNK